MLYGIGVNDANYVTQKYKVIDGKRVRTWVCPYYTRWKSMFVRCYSPKTLNNRPNYIGCEVCCEWKRFSIFKIWMKTQDWEGKHLDKDFLSPLSKVYSPETCVFITQSLNSFLNDHGNAKGKHLVGCSFYKASKKFRSQISDPFTGKIIGLGYYSSEIEAHLAWKSKKHFYACELAKHEVDNRIAETLRTRYKGGQHE